MAASMKMTMYIMPLMSAFIAISVPAGLGLYWIATAVVQTIITVFINRYYDKLGADEIVKRNVEKRNNFLLFKNKESLCDSLCAECCRLRQTTASRECASLAHSAYYLIGNSIGISY